MLTYKTTDAEYYPPSMFSEDVLNMFPSAKWWNFMAIRTKKRNNLPSDFCKFNSNLLSCPASSAVIEQIFSTFGMVWSKLRNCLGPDKAVKLVKIYISLHSNITDIDK